MCVCTLVMCSVEKPGSGLRDEWYERERVMFYLSTQTQLEKRSRYRYHIQQVKGKHSVMSLPFPYPYSLHSVCVCVCLRGASLPALLLLHMHPTTLVYIVKHYACTSW